jgi:hypothetical protein
MAVGAELVTKLPFDTDNTAENKGKALEALKSRGSRHDAALAADLSLKR